MYWTSISCFVLILVTAVSTSCSTPSPPPSDTGDNTESTDAADDNLGEGGDDSDNGDDTGDSERPIASEPREFVARALTITRRKRLSWAAASRSRSSERRLDSLRRSRKPYEIVDERFVFGVGRGMMAGEEVARPVIAA